MEIQRMAGRGDCRDSLAPFQLEFQVKKGPGSDGVNKDSYNSSPPIFSFYYYLIDHRRP
jgi:hypothetical protein